MTEFDPKRRNLLKATAAAASGVVATGRLAADAQAATAAPSAQQSAAGTVNVLLRVNGTEHQMLIDPRTTLLDALRERLHLTGSKKGCDQGQCGACTVIVGGRRINSCLSLAVMHDGDEITTIEGLGTPHKLHPMQAAFVRHDGYQCGYCTPGQICAAAAMLREIEAGVPSYVTADLASRAQLSREEVRERMSGNLCRCGAQNGIVDAILEVAQGTCA